MDVGDLSGEETMGFAVGNVGIGNNSGNLGAKMSVWKQRMAQFYLAVKHAQG